MFSFITETKVVEHQILRQLSSFERKQQHNGVQAGWLKSIENPALETIGFRNGQDAKNMAVFSPWCYGIGT